MLALLLLTALAAPSEFTFGAGSGLVLKLDTIANLESTPATIRYGARLFPVSMSGVDESTALYVRVDPTGAANMQTGFYMEVTDEQQDTEAGAFKVIHNGAGDAMYIAAFGSGPALETASFANGSRGFISTFQTIGGAVGDFSGSTQYSAITGWDGTGGSNATPLYGVYYSALSMGQSFAVRLQDSSATGFTWGQPEFSIREYALDKYRFRVYNTGQLTMESTAATAGAPLQAAPMLELRGSYWNGSAAVDKDVQWQSSMDGSGNPVLYLQMGTNAAEFNVVTYYSDGDVVAAGGIQPAKVTSDPCGGYTEGSIFYNDTANVMCFCDGTNDLKISDGSACF